MLKKKTQQKSVLSIVFMTTILWVGGASLSSKNAQADVAFNPPGGSAPSGRGGASRGDAICSSNPVEFSRYFLPVTPANLNYGLTIAERPTFFINVPPTSAQQAFFSLKDEMGKIHYQATVPMSSKGSTGKGSMMRITLPQSVSPLVVGKRYQWGVAALCSAKLKPDSPFVSSWIQRVEPSAKLVNQITQATPLDRASLYASNGIWYDTLTTIADSRQQQPNNPTLVSTWSKLLTSVGLGEIASQPLN